MSDFSNSSNHGINYNREKLYEEIWVDTMIEVSKRYGVSNVALAKTCKKLNIPRPPVGHWVKKRIWRRSSPSATS